MALDPSTLVPELRQKNLAVESSHIFPRLRWAAQCGPTSTATVDDTHCHSGCFGKPFSVSFAAVARRRSAVLLLLGWWWTSLGPMREMCVPTSVLGALSALATQCEQFASGSHHGSVAEVPSTQPFRAHAG